MNIDTLNLEDDYLPSKEKIYWNYINIGNQFYQTKKWREASAAYQEAIYVNPDHFHGYFNLAQVNRKLNKLEKAITFFQQVIKIKPEHYLSYQNLGDIFFIQKQWKKAIAAYQKTLDINPNLSYIHQQLADAFYQQAQLERAYLPNNYQQNIQQNPNNFTNHLPSLENILNNNKRILYIDDRIPHADLGSGFTRSHQILTTAINLGYNITLYPTDLRQSEDWKTTYLDIPQTVEVMKNYGLARLSQFLRERKAKYDLIFISRPHNLEQFNTIISEENLQLTAKIIYDAEALFCLREIQKRQIRGETFTEEQIKKECEDELKLAQTAHHIIAVSPQEQEKFQDYGYTNVSILGHSIPVTPTPNKFSDRRDLLFVGAIHGKGFPNADSVLWLCQDIFPTLKSNLEQPIQLLIAGNWSFNKFQQQIQAFVTPEIKILGKVDNLAQLYNHSRIFVAPTRFGAGIAHKVHEAAAYGLPVVTTSLIANQLGWKNEQDLLVADTAQEFAHQCIRLYQDMTLWEHIRRNGMRKIDVECSPKMMAERLDSILNSRE